MHDQGLAQGEGEPALLRVRRGHVEQELGEDWDAALGQLEAG